jgi:hypothetical protein
MTHGRTLNHIEGMGFAASSQPLNTPKFPGNYRIVG